MTMYDYYTRNVPEYYRTMYLDGYTPQEILMSMRWKMIREREERQPEQPTNINIITEVRIK